MKETKILLDNEKDSKIDFDFEKKFKELDNRLEANIREQRRNNQGKVVCKHWFRNLCKNGANCKYLHEYNPGKMPLCQFYEENGDCSTENCPFLHISEEDKIPPCPWYERGFCMRGPNCPNKHEPSRACPQYMLGYCPFGRSCPLMHGKFMVTDAAVDKVKRYSKRVHAPIQSSTHHHHHHQDGIKKEEEDTM